ncbi:MAG: hypothetical protein QOH12_3352 [Solirubrobacteraceae bacterium]|nr:hypothetical protein [Solirubrobacteraceae bacterium]
MTELSSFDANAPLLVVTSFAPSNQGGGAVIVRSLLRGSESRVVWASLEAAEQGYDGPTAQIRAGRRPWLTPPIVAARRIDELAQAHSASAIWAVAHGALVPWLPALAKTSARGLHVSIHDEPAWGTAFRGRRQLPLVPWLHVQFDRTIAAATSLDAIGGGMRALIARRSGRDSIVIHRVLDEPVPVNDVRRDRTRLTIGLLGSVYGRHQFADLTQMLARASALVGVPARLVVVGARSARLESAVRTGGVDVTFTGHLAEPDGIDLLRRSFALYVGYPFGLRDRMIRRTSFPAKLATYVQAARPLLVHAPYDSSLAPLFGLQPFVIPWASRDIGDGARVLASAWREESLQGSQDEGAETVRQAYFSPGNRERLFLLLNQLAGPA